MRPFVWGGLLLMVVLAAALHPVVTTRTAEPATATEVHGPHYVITTTPPKVQARPGRKPPRPAPPAVDLNAVVYTDKVTGEYRLSEKDAWESALDVAVNELMHDLRLSQPLKREFIREKVVKGQQEERQKNIIDGQDAVRLHLDLQLTRGVYLDLSHAERAVRVQDRMEGVARVLVLLVIGLGSLGTYIRLDEWTKGYYTGRLRLVAIAVVAVGAMLIIRV